MAKYIIKRLVAGVLSLFILITITFFLMHVIPGGPFSPSEPVSYTHLTLPTT